MTYVELPSGTLLETRNPELWPEAKHIGQSAGKQRMREEAIADLRKTLPPGSTVYTVLRHVSTSGMYRAIDCYALQGHADGTVTKFWLSRFIARAIDARFDEKREAIGVAGCGMDMGYHLVYSLGRTLYPDGVPCVGTRCQSNDHSNGDRNHTPHTEETPHMHKDGGYALRHEWI